ncbi:unnamed protein product [Closterium sp. NIES-65]|nr:unnamed protein product [Closterium sp. NIES-65]
MSQAQHQLQRNLASNPKVAPSKPTTELPQSCFAVAFRSPIFCDGGGEGGGVGSAVSGSRPHDVCIAVTTDHKVRHRACVRQPAQATKLPGAPSGQHPCASAMVGAPGGAAGGGVVAAGHGAVPRTAGLRGCSGAPGGWVQQGKRQELWPGAGEKWSERVGGGASAEEQGCTGGERAVARDMWMTFGEEFKMLPRQGMDSSIFGVLMLVVLTGWSSRFEDAGETKHIVVWASECLSSGGSEGLKHPTMDAPGETVLRVVELAVSCTVERTASRPSMAHIATQLQAVREEVVGKEESGAAIKVDA